MCIRIALIPSVGHKYGSQLWPQRSRAHLDLYCAEARLGVALSLVGLAVLVSEIEGSTTGGEVYF